MIIAVAILLAYTIKIAVLDDDVKKPRGWRIRIAAKWIGGYVIALATINLASVILQCGFDACHTTGYRLL